MVARAVCLTGRKGGSWKASGKSAARKATASLMASLILIAAGSSSFAESEKTDILVTARVQGVCSVSATSVNITLTVDGSSDSPKVVVAGAQPQIKCTNNHRFAIACESANAFRLRSGVDEIPYTLNCPAGGVGNGFSAGKYIALAVGGSVATADYQNAPMGTYTDTVVVTVNY